MYTHSSKHCVGTYPFSNMVKDMFSVNVMMCCDKLIYKLKLYEGGLVCVLLIFLLGVNLTFVITVFIDTLLSPMNQPAL